MNQAAPVLLAIAGGCMLADWWSVVTNRRSVEAVAKPAVMVALLGLAVAADIDPAATRG